MKVFTLPPQPESFCWLTGVIKANLLAAKAMQ